MSDNTVEVFTFLDGEKSLNDLRQDFINSEMFFANVEEGKKMIGTADTDLFVVKLTIELTDKTVRCTKEEVEAGAKAYAEKVEAERTAQREAIKNKIANMLGLDPSTVQAVELGEDEHIATQHANLN